MLATICVKLLSEQSYLFVFYFFWLLIFINNQGKQRKFLK